MKELAAGRLVRAMAGRAAQRCLPVDPLTVTYNSFGGQFSDNPRAIFEELQRRSPQRRHYWVSDRDGVVTPSARPVRMYSLQYYSAIGRSRYLVSNAQMPRNLPDRYDLTYLQTWHGTPLKCIGYDNPQWAPGVMAATLGRDAQKWDFLISPNEHSTAVFRRAFEYDGRVLETGYPRNDVLFSPDAGHIGVETRRRLGVDEASTLVLYAPTWRDDITDDHGRPRFSPILDLEAIVAALPSHTVMARLHHMLEPGSLATSPRVLNVSDHADIADLYLAADVLITDYSSVMFDFAITRKPLVFFVPDMEHYGNSTRGFYFDLSTCAPGPLCTTTEDVIDALREPQAVRRSYQDSAESFRRKFCPWDDGTASVRVVDAVFGPAPSTPSSSSDPQTPPESEEP